MSSLAEQRLIILELERAITVNRVRLIDAVSMIKSPVVVTKEALGTALIAAELAPGVSALVRLLVGTSAPQKRGRRIVAVCMEAPQFLRSLLRFLP